MDTTIEPKASAGAPAQAPDDHPSAVAVRGPRPPAHRKKPVIAVAAVQGAFIEHERRLVQLGCSCIELRQQTDLAQPFDGLVLPGGESTAQAKLLRDLGMLEPLRRRIASGLPTLGTCAGLILLAERVEADGPAPAEAGAGPNAGVAEAPGGCTMRGAFATLPVTVRRNAYGRQLGSFRTSALFGDEDESARAVAMTFIRAPRIEAVRGGVRTLATVGGAPVAVQAENQIGCAFHPELEDSNVVYGRFLALVEEARAAV